MNTSNFFKLTKDNSLSWKTQLIPSFRAHKFLGYLEGSIPPPTPLLPTSSSSTTPTVNPEYDPWFEQDQLILSILISSIFEPLLPQVVGLDSAGDVWAALEKSFLSQSSARVMQTRYQLATLKKGNLSIQDYFQKAKSLADILFAIANI